MNEARWIEEFEALLDTGRHDLAESRARKLLGTHPDDPLLLCMLARAQFALDQPDRSLHSARAAMSGWPDSAAPRLLAALALASLHRLHEAEQMAITGVRLEPDLPQAHLVLAQVTLDTDPALARDAAVRAAELDPHNAQAHFVVGCAADRQGDRRTARLAFRKTLELQPDHSGAMTNLGREEMIAGRTVTALGQLGRAVSLDPQDELMRANVDAPVTRWLERGLFLVTLVAVAAIVWQPALLVGAIIAVVGSASWSVHVVRRLPRGGRQLLASYPRRHTVLVGAAAITGLALVASGVSSVVDPASTHTVVPVLCGLAVLTLAGRAVGSARAHR